MNTQHSVLQKFCALASLSVLFAALMPSVAATQAQAANPTVAPAAAASSGYTANGIPLNGQVFVGASAVDNAAYTQLENTLGVKPGMRRTYFRPGGETKAIASVAADLAAGRLPWISFNKLTFSWADMAAGEGDAWAQDIADRLGALDGPVWIAFAPEPEGRLGIDGTREEWLAMQRHLAPIFKAKPNIAYTIVLTGWAQWFGSDGMNDWWPGAQYVDVLGFDPYNWYSTTNRNSGKKQYSWNELKDYYDKIVAWKTNTGNTNVKWALAETGLPDEAAAATQNMVAPDGRTVATRGPGSEWLQRGYDDMKAAGGIGLAYFHVSPAVNAEPTDWTWLLSEPNKMSDFRAIVSKTARLTDSPAPATPMNVAATASGQTTVDVSWSASPTATSYKVFRNGSQVGTPTTTTYSDTGLTPGTTYTYTVKASNTGGDSPTSNTATTTTLANATSPGYTPNGIPLAGQIFVGAATVDGAAYAQLENALGVKPGLRRSYSRPGGETKAIDAAAADISAGRIPWVSFKLPHSWAQMKNGAGDAWAQDIANRLGALPGPVWVAFHHEPENDGTPADWVAIQQRLAPIMHTKPNIAYTIVLTGWAQFYGPQDMGMNTWWPGKQHIDIVGFDPYNWYSTTNRTSGKKHYGWTELKDYYDKIEEWQTSSGNTDVKWALAEAGLPDEAAAATQNMVAPDGKVVATRGPGSEWLQRGYDDMKAAGGIALSYFHVDPSMNAEPADWTWLLSEPNKMSDFRAIVSKTARFNETPTQIAPTAPASVTATATGATSINVSWAASPTATSYKVFRNGTQVGTPTATVYSDTGLTPGTTYTYTVKAINAGGDSASSTATSAKTVVDAPTAPANVTATATNQTTVNVSWSASPTATSYKVFRNGVRIATTPVSLSYTDSGLTHGTTYSYTIKASNAGGDSPLSASATVTTRPNAPATPPNLAATTTDTTTVNLSWTASPTATFYKVFRDGTLVGTPASTSYIDSGLAPGTTHSYTVKASNTGGDSAFSAVAIVTTMTTLPNAITLPTIVTNDLNDVVVSWTAPANGGSPITGYVARATSRGAPTVRCETTTLACRFTTLQPGITYRIVVAARNGAGVAPDSAPVSVTTVKPASYVAVSGISKRTATPVATIPRRAVSGDTLLMFASTSDPVSVAAAPSGWKLLETVNDNNLRTRVYQRTATTGDPGKRVRMKWSKTTKNALVLGVYRNVNASAITVSSLSETAATNQHVAPAVSGEFQNGYLTVSLWADRSSRTTGWTLSNDNTERLEKKGRGTGYVSVVLGDRKVSTSSTASASSKSFEAAGITVKLPNK